MKLRDLAAQKLVVPAAMVLARVAPLKKKMLTIHYHCEGKPIGETVFEYTPARYADWFESRAAALPADR